MTVYQKQCLLGYLGYNPGVIDGIDGAKTRAAMEAFRRDHGSADLLETVRAAAPTDFWRDIRHFTRTEMACRCGKCSGYPAEPSEKLMRLADAVRDEVGVPMTVSSGVRCVEHNAEVGGAANSRHLYGRAMDVCAGGKSAAELLRIVRAHPETAYSYAINDRYVHFDVV